jgi:hypothetical protein
LASPEDTLVVMIEAAAALAGQFWPVLVGISWLFGLSCYSFWRLPVRNN